MRYTLLSVIFAVFLSASLTQARGLNLQDAGSGLATKQKNAAETITLHLKALTAGSKGQPEGMIWATASGRALNSSELPCFLSQYGVRRMSFRRAKAPYLSTTKIKVVADALASYQGMMTLYHAANLSHIGIKEISLFVGTQSKTGLDTRGFGERVGNKMLFQLPRLTIKPAKTGGTTYSLARPGVKETQKAESIADFAVTFQKISQGEVKALVLVILGEVTCGEIQCAAAAATAGGIKHVAIQGSYLSGLGLTFSGFLSGDAESKADDSLLKSGARGIILRTIADIQSDGLWLESRASDLDPVDHAWTRIAGSTLIASMLVMEGEYDEGAVNEKKTKKAVKKLADGVGVLGLHPDLDGSQFGHAWMTLCLVRCWGFAEPTEFTNCLPRMLDLAMKTELPGGGWSARRGGKRPDLLTSTMMAIAIKEGIEAEIIEPGRARKPRLAWLAAITETKTGFVRAPSDSKLGNMGLSSHTAMRQISGYHPEFETAAAAALRLAVGEDPNRGMLAKQLTRLKAMPPQTGFGTGEFDIEYGHLVAWIMTELGSADWVPMRRHLGNALQSFIENSTLAHGPAPKKLRGYNLIRDVMGAFCAHQLTQFGVTVKESNLEE